MRGVLLTTLVLVSLVAPLVVATTVGWDEQYLAGDTLLRIDPISTAGVRYILPDNTTRIWNTKDCRVFSVVRVCLTASSNKTATFQETYVGAKLTAHTTLTPTTVDLGKRIDGTISLTNPNLIAATNVVVTFSLDGPATFSDGTASQSTTLTVLNSRDIAFIVTPTGPGTIHVTGSATYFDGNRTRSLALDNRTATVTIPFTWTVTYDNTTTSAQTGLLVMLTRKSNDNLTTTITAVLPPEALVNSSDRRVHITDTTLVIKNTLTNTSKANLSANYSFTAPPTAPLTVSIDYSANGGSIHHVSGMYPYEITSVEAPSIGVRVDPTPAGQEGTVRVLVTGNVTGALAVNGPIITAARIAGPGTYDFATRPATEGNYTITINYTWTDAYGKLNVLDGKAVFLITTAIAMNDTKPLIDNGTGPTVVDTTTPTVTLITNPTAKHDDLLLWICGGVATGCLAALFMLLRRLRDPIHRIEVLLRKTAELHRVQQARAGKLTPAELARLKALEDELRGLQGKL